MKNLLRSLSLCLFALFVLSAVATAQSKPLDVDSGRLLFTLEPTFVAFLNSQGITVTYDHYKVTGNMEGFKVATGTVDGNLGTGDIRCSGRITLQSGSVKVVLLGMTLDTSNPAFPFISAMTEVNGVYRGRHQIFQVVSGMPYQLPMRKGNTRSLPGYFKGQHFLDYFQIPGFDPTQLVGSFSVDMTLDTP